jgi:hexosaminidase
MPAPAEVSVSPGRTPVTGAVEVTLSGTAGRRLASAAARFQTRWLRRLGRRPGAAAPSPGFPLTVTCSGAAPAVPVGDEDESYHLTVGAAGARLDAATDLGALHGLETLLQLIGNDAQGAFLPSADIRDRPRFAWRGLMIDVARHWQPIEVVERNIDAMAAVKLNVLHLHLTDDQGFRIESRTHPELQEQGSDGHFFTQDQIRAIIAFAAERGIRVVPEFDTPGHATSWVVSHPELASAPGPYGIERWWGVFNPVLDPTNEATYALLADFLGEMADLFPDRFIHVGGDENNGVQWSANPRIQAYIKAHGLTDNPGLHAYFNRRIGEILSKHGKRLIGWDEILNPALPKGAVIDSWRGPEGIGKATAMGYDCILANGYYIDLCYPASDHYAADPMPEDSALTPAQRAHVLGGEATMWSEWVTPETIDSRIWPRTAAIAERLWSPGNVRDPEEMYRRLAVVSQRLAEAGALHEANRDVMLRYLVGQNLDTPGIDSLRTFLDLVEPVKHYDRGGQQIWGNQRVPLTGIADAARPESETSRAFARSVDRILFSGAEIDRDRARELTENLGRWEAASAAVADTLSDSYPALREANLPAKGLRDACDVGTAALKALEASAPLSAEALASDLAILDRAGEPNLSATLIPLLRPVRLLAVAAARQGARTGQGGDAWRNLVTAEAFPGPAAK